MAAIIPFPPESAYAPPSSRSWPQDSSWPMERAEIGNVGFQWRLWRSGGFCLISEEKPAATGKAPLPQISLLRKAVASCTDRLHWRETETPGLGAKNARTSQSSPTSRETEHCRGTQEQRNPNPTTGEASSSYRVMRNNRFLLFYNQK